MPDWEQQLKERLAELKLALAVREDVISELAGHLEDAYEGFRKQGIGAEEAAQRAWGEFSDGRVLARKICRAKQEENAMNQRAKCLWIPSLAMLALLLATSVGVLRAQMFPHGIVIGSTVSFLIYVPWLVAFPAIGALGAYWSRQMGGSLASRLGVSLFPAICLLALYLVSVVPILYRLFSFPDPIFHVRMTRILILRYDLVCALHWVIYPALALILGALPFLKGDADQFSRPIDIQN